MFSYINSRSIKTIVSLGLVGVSILSSTISSQCVSSEDDFRKTKLKRQVGYKAIDDYVKSGQTIGLGSGSTCFFSLERLEQKLKSHALKDITVIPTSEFTKKQCISRNIPITTLSRVASNNQVVDIVIDGVDEIDADLQMSKGGSGCLLREKMIEKAAAQVVIVADDSKLTTQLGTGHPLAIEVTPFSHEYLRKSIESLPSFYGNARAILRRGQANNNSSDGSEIAVTDNGHYIIDVTLLSSLFNKRITNIILGIFFKSNPRCYKGK